MDWSVVGYFWIIVVFLISCLDSHSDGTHSLIRIHWWASVVMVNSPEDDLFSGELKGVVQFDRGWVTLTMLMGFLDRWKLV